MAQHPSRTFTSPIYYVELRLQLGQVCREFAGCYVQSCHSVMSCPIWFCNQVALVNAHRPAPVYGFAVLCNELGHPLEILLVVEVLPDPNHIAAPPEIWRPILP